MNNVIRSGELGRSHRCSFNRSKNLILNQEVGLNYKKTSKIKEGIKKLLYIKRTREIEESDKKDFMLSLISEFKDMGYKTEKTARINAEDAYRQAMRYVLSETRTPAFPIKKVIEIAGMPVEVSPDEVFFSDDCIEVVKLRASKPTVALKSSIQDKGANTSLELYSMLQYGKQFIPVGKEMTVKASYYFLRKNTDSPKDGVFDVNFFEGDTKGGGNVVSIEDKYIGGGMTCIFGCKQGCAECEDCPYPQMCENLTDWGKLDAVYLPLADEFKKGTSKEDCTPDMCENCDFKHVCSFNLPPMVINKEKKKRSVRDLNLTEAQEKAIYFRKGICRINAGAGAGKTLVVAVRVATMISEGVNPGEIMLLTFTNTGAEEMRERVSDYNEDFGNDVDMSQFKATTFNAFGDEFIIKAHWEELGFTEEPRLLDEVEQSKLIITLLNKNVIDGLDYRNFDMATKNCKGALTIAVKALNIIKKEELNIGQGEVLRNLMGSDTRFVSNSTAYDRLIDLFFEYDRTLRENNLYEYEDQNKMVFEYIHKNPYFLEDMGVKHIIVDEFQDSNLGQLSLIKELRDTKNFESLMVVGDDSQAIFSFQGSSPEFIINFFDEMGEQGDDIFLVENHRSTPEIIEFANKINAINTIKVAKDLIATRPHGKPVVVRGFADPMKLGTETSEEYQYIVDGIKKHIADGTKLEDIAFIASNKSELLKMGTLLTEEGIDWVMLSPEVYTENSRVIAAIELAKAINNTRATKCMLPYLNCLYEGKLMEKDSSEIKGLIEALAEKLLKIKYSPGPVALKAYMDMLTGIDCNDEIYKKFLEKLSYRKTLEDVITYCSDFESYGNKLTVRREHDYRGVVLTTAHSSKGLEWPVVYNSITNYYGEEESKLSHKAAREEKRRLLFVSATRARDELYITGRFVSFGKTGDETFNHFLKECYDAVGQDFNPRQEIDAKKAAKKAEKEAKKSEEKFSEEKKSA